MQSVSIAGLILENKIAKSIHERLSGHENFMPRKFLAITVTYRLYLNTKLAENILLTAHMLTATVLDAQKTMSRY